MKPGHLIFGSSTRLTLLGKSEDGTTSGLTTNYEPRTTNCFKMQELRDEFRTFFISECQTAVQFKEIQEFIAEIDI